jgi:hypothetical protein
MDIDYPPAGAWLVAGVKLSLDSDIDRENTTVAHPAGRRGRVLPGDRLDHGR